ncbi:MAG TPA: hypothetical protein DIS76_01070, partial [Rhodospirillaceae bacterium]|nr:hypothetical protein [Rhodospirillaceae bacterium]
ASVALLSGAPTTNHQRFGVSFNGDLRNSQEPTNIDNMRTMSRVVNPIEFPTAAAAALPTLQQAPVVHTSGGLNL